MHRRRRLLDATPISRRLRARLWRSLEGKALAVIGMRRAGKTSFLHQCRADLNDWIEPIACMWRFARNNGITEGFHRKMKLIQRRAYGFRNFDNYHLRVIAQCG